MVVTGMGKHSARTRYGSRLLYGSLAGTAATILMTGTMRRLHEALPETERYPLPPRELVDSVTDGERRPATQGKSSEDGAAASTMAAHFAYGAAAGALFALQGRRSVAAGTAYGLAVWTASYLGWVPGTRLLKPATRHPWRRNLLMAAAHVAWGGSLATGLAEIERADEGGIFRARKRRRDIAT